MSSYLTDKDWEELRLQYSDAYHFLLYRQLCNELNHLTNVEGKVLLNTWEKDRLAELRDWKRIDDDIKQAHRKED